MLRDQRGMPDIGRVHADPEHAKRCVAQRSGDGKRGSSRVRVRLAQVITGPHANSAPVAGDQTRMWSSASGIASSA